MAISTIAVVCIVGYMLTFLLCACSRKTPVVTPSQVWLHLLWPGFIIGLWALGIYTQWRTVLRWSLLAFGYTAMSPTKPFEYFVAKWFTFYFKDGIGHAD